MLCVPCLPVKFPTSVIPSTCVLLSLLPLRLCFPLSSLALMSAFALWVTNPFCIRTDVWIPLPVEHLLYLHAQNVLIGRKMGGIGNFESTLFMDDKSFDPIMMFLSMHQALIATFRHAQICLISLKYPQMKLYFHLYCKQTPIWLLLHLHFFLKVGALKEWTCDGLLKLYFYYISAILGDQAIHCSAMHNAPAVLEERAGGHELHTCPVREILAQTGRSQSEWVRTWTRFRMRIGINQPSWP